MDESRSVQPFEYFLKPGYLVANYEDSVVRAVLGNCVAVTLYDRNNRFGGMNHFVLPGTKDRRRATPQYGNVAVTALIKMLFKMGAELEDLEAQIFGGAANSEMEDSGLGEENIRVARKILSRYNVPVVSEDVGGVRGRKIIHHTGTNETIVIKVDHIRESDWFDSTADLRFARYSR